VSLLVACNDGPAAGASFEVTRCPKLVRVVIDGTSGKRDILNEADDEPTVNEAVHWYRWDGRSAGHLCTRGRGCHALVDLDHAPDIVAIADRRRTRQLTLPGTGHDSATAERQAAERQKQLLLEVTR
jgi:hypothetical protein